MFTNKTVGKQCLFSCWIRSCFRLAEMLAFIMVNEWWQDSNPINNSAGKQVPLLSHWLN